MKWIKTFESFDGIVDEDFFIDSFWDVRDEWNLTKVQNPDKNGWTDDFLNNCYWSEYAEPHDKKSQFYHLREAFFGFKLSMIVTTDFTNHEMVYDSGAVKILQNKYPELLNSIDSYRKLVERILKDSYGYLCSSSVSTSFRRLFIKCEDGSIERPSIVLIGIDFRFREPINSEKPYYKTKKMLKQLTFNDEEKRKLKEIGYDLDESIKGDDYIDMSNIESAFLDIKDDFDLDEISYDQFYRWMTMSSHLDESNFSNSYRIFEKVGAKGLESRVQVTILIKSKISLIDWLKFKLDDMSRKGIKLIRDEYPSLWEGIKNFISVVQLAENLDSYFHTSLRAGADFTFYHATISFYPKTSWFTTERFKVKNINAEDVIKSIKGGGRIFATIIKDFPKNDPKEPLTPVSIDDDGLVTVEYDGKEYEVDLKNIEKIDIPGINEGFTIDQRSSDFKIFYNEDYSDEGNILRDEVLNHIEDILYHFSDEDFKIEVGYGYPNIDELEFKLTPNYKYEKYITEVDMNHVQMLNDYLKGEGFVPVQSNILRELDIRVYFQRKLISYPLPRIKYMIKGGLLSHKIEFKFKIPKI